MLAGVLVAVVAPLAKTAETQTPALPNPYHIVENWAQLPANMKWGGVISIELDAKGNFSGPSDVAIAPNGDIFIADGHVANNGRMVKFSKDGKFVKTWGKKGSGAGEFDTPHSIAMDSQGRLFVADRGNNRIQILDQNGKSLDQWKQFGTPSGAFIDKNDNMYVADSQSNATQNPGYKRGIYIGSAKTGKVTALIPNTTPDPDKNNNAGAEGVAADAQGNVFAGDVTKMTLTKYAKR